MSGKSSRSQYAAIDALIEWGLTFKQSGSIENSIANNGVG
jgi:hypothetical protein